MNNGLIILLPIISFLGCVLIGVLIAIISRPLLNRSGSKGRKIQTFFYNVDNKKLSDCKHCTTIIRLMWACNDISLANQLLGINRREKMPIPNYINIEKGSSIYFIRLQTSHLYEGWRILNKIQNDNDLKQLLDICRPEVKNAFCEFKNQTSGQNKQKFKRCVKDLRDNVGFHYQHKEDKINQAIKGYKKLNKSLNILSDDIRYCRFGSGDRFHDEITIHQIWGIPYNKNAKFVQDKANEIVEYISNLCELFLSFAGNFIAFYFEKNSLVDFICREEHSSDKKIFDIPPKKVVR